MYVKYKNHVHLHLSTFRSMHIFSPPYGVAGMIMVIYMYIYIYIYIYTYIYIYIYIYINVFRNDILTEICSKRAIAPPFTFSGPYICLYTLSVLFFTYCHP